ncbi:hypothetical protein, partial [Streptomyces chrestomyceticus]|uniref:hypothetical protein n=1 Tax=Streptomyces chrestomyceticus TaxID=68185 RepID=UPI0037B89DD5
VRFGLSASSRFQPYQIRSAFPLSVSGSLLERAAVQLSLSGPSDVIRSDYRSVAGPNSFPMPRRRGVLRLSA